MAETIKQINVQGVIHDVEDSYARRRIEGASTVYSIKASDTSASISGTFVNIITGETITSTNVVNSAFKVSTNDVVVAPNGVLILNNGSDPKVTGVTYGILVEQLALGDTVYVVETTYPDRWVSAINATSKEHTLTALQNKSAISGYVPKGTYTTTGPSTDATGSGGAQTATGTATITYKKPDANTGSAGGTGTASNTGNAGSATINGSSFTFAGTTATISSSGSYKPAGTISGSQTVGSHSHTVNVGTTSSGTLVTGATTGASGSHSHTVNLATTGSGTLVTGATTSATGSHSHTVNVATTSSGNLVTGYPSFSGGTFTQGAKASLAYTTSGTSSALANATVSNGVLSWTTASYATEGSKITSWSANGNDSFTASSLGTASSTSFNYVTSATLTAAGSHSHTVNTSTTSFNYVSGATTSAAGSHSHTVNTSTTSFNYVSGATTSAAGGVTISGSNFTFAGTTATITVSASYKPEGTLGGSVTIASHSHSYTAPAAHSHSIGTSDQTATGTAAVSVTNHTHSLSNHTHDVDLTGGSLS